MLFSRANNKASGKSKLIAIVQEAQFRMSNIQRPILVVFGGGSADFHDAARRLKNQAKATKKFGKIYAFTDKSRPLRKSFFSKHRDFINQNPRGFGSYIWKPYIINLVQSRVRNNRTIVYLDAGVYINLATSAARRRFDDYVRIAWTSKIFAFQLNQDQYAGQGFPDLREIAWNRRDILDSLAISEKHRLTSQIEAGVIIIRNSKETRQFTAEWLFLLENNDYEFLREPDVKNQHIDFIEHRFDQSVFSALMKARGYSALAAENWFYPDWFSSGAGFPFWSVRMRRG